MGDAEGDLRGWAYAQREDEQGQDDDLRNAIEQQNDRHEAAAGECVEADAEANGHADGYRDDEGEGDLVEGDAQRLRQALGGDDAADFPIDPTGRRQEHLVDEETRGHFP